MSDQTLTTSDAVAPPDLSAPSSHLSHLSWEGASTHRLEDVTRETLRLRALELTILDGVDAGRSMRIERPMTFVVGSGQTADLQIRADAAVSREHLRITLQPDGIVLRDEGSRNGTWLGGLRLRDATLTAPQVVTIGATRLRLTPESGVIELPLSPRTTFGDAIGVSPAMRHLFAILEKAAPTNVTVLLEGESGVGKEVLAHAIHRQSGRADGPFVAIDCGAVAPNLIESELFGHEKGAFTGADRSRVGAFEHAHGGTIFLDEIGELPLEMQPKLLRALEARQVRPVGSKAYRSVDVRFIAATNKNLSEAAHRGSFRPDLFYRLAVARVSVPPLRDRREDILPLAQAFLRRLTAAADAELPADMSAMLASYSWPGNVRELRNVIERYVVFGPSSTDLFDRSPSSASEVADLSHLPYHEARRIVLERFEQAYLPAVLANAGDVVSAAAQVAQVGRGSFHRMLRRLRRPSGLPTESDDPSAG